MQVLCLGPGRPGTDSLRNALLVLGYDAVFHGYEGMTRVPMTHQAWVQVMRRKFDDTSSPDHTITRADFDAIIGDCEAVTDMPCVNFARELIEAFPEAKVIINTRELDAWYASYQSTFERYRGGWSGFRNRARSWFCAELYWLQRSGEYNFERFWNGDSHTTAKWRYREHVAMVKGSVQADRLLEWKVQDGWGPLCEFLGKEVPKQDFPSGNNPKGFDMRVGKLLGNCQRRADRNMLITATSVAALLIAGFRVARGFKPIHA
ncbi:hypothetical protein PG984_004227 [Apiospora sp. TS-2023a]